MSESIVQPVYLVMGCGSVVRPFPKSRCQSRANVGVELTQAWLAVAGGCLSELLWL